MKFIVNKKAIEVPLSRLVRVIQRTHIPILDCVLIKADECVRLTTSNSEMSVNTDVSAIIENGGSVAVDAKSLSDAIRQLPDVDVHFEKTDNSLVVKYNKGKFELPLYDVSDYPELSSVDSEVYKVNSKLISDALPYTADDELRPVMNGVYLDFSGGCVVASDGHSLIKQEGISGEGAVNLPKATANFVKDLGELDVKFTDNGISISSGGYEVVSKVVEGRYPNYNSVIPDNQIKVAFNKTELMGALKRVSLFSDVSKLVEFDIKGDSTTLSGRDLDFSTSAKEVVSSNGEDIRIGFKSDFMIKLINSCDSDEVVLELSEPSRAMVLREGDKTMLLMPMMIN